MVNHFGMKSTNQPPTRTLHTAPHSTTTPDEPQQSSTFHQKQPTAYYIKWPLQTSFLWVVVFSVIERTHHVALYLSGRGSAGPPLFVGSECVQLYIPWSDFVRSAAGRDISDAARHDRVLQQVS